MNTIDKIKRGFISIKSLSDQEKTPDVCLAAIGVEPWDIRHVPCPSDALRMTAVEAEPWVIKVIDNRTPALCLRAVEGDGLALQFLSVIEQTKKIVNAAIKNTPDAIIFVKNQNLRQTIREQLNNQKKLA